MVDTPNKLSDKEFNSKQSSKPPHDSDGLSQSDTDQEVNKVSLDVTNFKISTEKKQCLLTNSVQNSADPSPVSSKPQQQTQCLLTNSVQKSAYPSPISLKSQQQIQNNNMAGRAKTIPKNQDDNNFESRCVSDFAKHNQLLEFQNLKTIVQDDPTLPDSIRQALIAKHQRSLGLVGSLERFKAKNICSALSTLDIKCMKVWQTEQNEDQINLEYTSKRGLQIYN